MKSKVYFEMILWWEKSITFLKKYSAKMSNFLRREKLQIVEFIIGATTTDKIFDTNSSFHLKWCTKRKV